MSLSDFMPYGAPELIDGASPRLARSTLLASGLVALLVWSMGLVAAQWGTHEIPTIVLTPVFDPKAFRIEQLQPAAPQVQKIHFVANPEGEFHPVAEAPLIDPAVLDLGPVGPERSDDSGDPDATDAPVGPPAPHVPDPGEFVYTDELPQLARAVKPVYPDLAREAGVEGTVKLNLLVGLNGHVVRAIVRPGGSVPMLDEAAIAAALATVFTPALVNRHPVMVWVTQDYRFTLH